MEFGIFHIWKSGWNFTQLKWNSLYFTYSNVSAEFIMKYWIFCILLYENLYAEFHTWNMVFSILHIWKSGWWSLHQIQKSLYFTDENHSFGFLQIWRTNMVLELSLFHKRKYVHHWFFMKYGILCISYIKI